MTDYIKRSDTLELARGYYSQGLKEEAVPVRAIRNIPSADVWKWIPVSERLPEENSEVLIVTERRDVIYGTFADGLFSDDWQYYTLDYVVCWMYIPEPPKEET